MIRDTRFEIDLDILARNVRNLSTFLDQGAMGATRRPALCAVIKADAYGLGAVRVAREFARNGADMLAVACLQEALEIHRSFGEAPPVPLLVMGHTPDDGLEAAVAAGIRTTIFDLRQAQLLSVAAAKTGRPATVHLKIDTGFNRLGIKPDMTTGDLFGEMGALGGLEFEGIFTHLALCDAESDRRQFELFMATVAEAEGRGLRFRYRHVCDSIGLARYPSYRLDLVRAGAVLYGARPSNAPLAASLDVDVPFAFMTRVSRLRRIAEGDGVGYDFTWHAPTGGAVIATLPVGYVDGYRRCLSNKAAALLRGKRAPVVGLVCMDQLVVDATGIPDAREGDEVLLFGRASQGGGEITLLEMADWAGTNRNEILASIGRRVPRVYHRSGTMESVIDYLAP